MNYFKDLIHVMLPLLGLLLFILGIINKNRNYIVLSLWLSLFAIIIHYQIAGGEILGYYFNYSQSALYSINLLTLLACIIYLIFHSESVTNAFQYLLRFFAAFSIVGVALLLTNLWVNAWFIEHRMPGTPIFQVAVFKKLDYCSYRYVFYKIRQDGALSYMCPNHYGLIPAIGVLATTPDFLLRQLPPNLGKKFKSAQIMQNKENKVT